MLIRVIAVGKKHEAWVAEGIERYQKRLRQPFAVEWVFLPHSSLEADRARQEESERIHSRLGSDDFIILLDERGKMFDSPALSGRLTGWSSNSKQIVIIIGGAYGVTETLHARADVVWSLSPLVFPHQMVRLILIEQLYRAQQIAQGGSYHHE